MALSPPLKRVVHRVADVLGSYARRQGWWPLDSRLYFRVNEAWGQIEVIFVAHGFEGREYLENYASVMRYLEERLADAPELSRAIGLVIRTPHQIEEGGIYAIGPDYFFVRPRDLIRRTLREAVGVLKRYAKDHGWDDRDYQILYKVAAEQDRVHIVFIVGVSDPRDPRELRDSVQAFLRSRLTDDPEILNTLDLEVRRREELGQEGMSQLIDSGFADYWTITRA